MIHVTNNIWLSEEELDFTFVRSSGPGGQNVNKVSTAVQLRFNVAGSPSLPEGVRARLMRMAGRRLTDEGVLVIDSRRHRTRERNRSEAIERLVALIRGVAQPPVRRVATKPTQASRHRRLDRKTARGDLKRLRQRPDRD